MNFFYDELNNQANINAAAEDDNEVIIAGGLKKPNNNLTANIEIDNPDNPEEYIYGKLNLQVNNDTFKGLITDTTRTTVDILNSTIAVDIIKLPARLQFKEQSEITEVFTTFDATSDIIIDLTPYAKRVNGFTTVKLEDRNKLNFYNEYNTLLQSVELSPFVQEQSDLAQIDPTNETFVRNKKTKYLVNNGDSNPTIPGDTTKYATEKYVDLFGGKIDVIKVNGTAQDIVNKTIDIFVPIKTSQLTNDSDFATNISVETKIAAEAQERTAADTVLRQSIESNTTKINTEITDRQDADTSLEITFNNKLNQDVEVKDSDPFFAYDGDTVTFTEHYRNLNNGSTSQKSENISLADSTTAGLMSPADVRQISDNTSKIEALEGQTIRLLYDVKENPTAQEIADFVTSKGYTEHLERVAVVVVGTYHIWHYYSQSGWRDDGTDTVTQFTNNNPGIIKGATTDGQIYAETDGTGSVNGWSTLKNRVTNTETRLDNAESTIQSHATALLTKEDIANKVTTLTSESTNIQYPSAKVVYDNLQTKQPLLTSYLKSAAVSDNALTITKQDNTTVVFQTNIPIETISVNNIQQSIINKNVNIIVPENTSDLTNDSDFVSDSNYIHTDNNFTNVYKSNIETNNSKISNVQADWNSNSGLSQILNKPNNLATTEDIPTLISDLTNDRGFIDNTANNLINYYLKTETYTQTEINNLISAVPTIKIEIVSTLPTADVTTYFNLSKTIYMKQVSGQTYYDEYITIRTGESDAYVYNWEQIGSTQIDLSNYYTKSETDTLLDEKQPTLSSAQLYAVNSGITSGLVTQIGLNSTDITTLQSITTGLMSKNNPTGTGSLSLNRLADSTIGDYSTTVGYNNSASNLYTFAAGNTTKASGKSASAFGEGTQAIRKSQNVFGEYNISDPTGGINSRGTYVEIVGNGTGSSLANRSNARTLDWSGNEWLAGNLQAAGLTDGTTTKTMAAILAAGKLYSTSGQNTDGAMTQKATTDELNDKVEFVEDTTGSTDPSPFADYYNKTEIAGLLTNKADTNLRNINPTRTDSALTIDGVVGTKYSGAHICIESWVSNDGLMWYRKYDDGWKECGGYFACNESSTQKQVTFPLEFSNINYTLVVTPKYSTANSSVISTKVVTSTLTNSGFKALGTYISGSSSNWAGIASNYYCCGY